MSTIWIVIIVLLLVGGFGVSHWGYGPSGGLGLIVLILLILALTGRL